MMNPQTYESVNAHAESVDLDHIQKSMSAGAFDADTTLRELYAAARPIMHTLIVISSFWMPAKWKSIVVAFEAAMDSRFNPPVVG